MDLSRPEVLKSLMNKYGIRPQHRLGQNFLVDSRVLDAIVEASGAGPDDLVLEIGPGMGTLTQRLAMVGGRVMAIELDKRLVSILGETVVKTYPNVEIVQGDAGKTDLRALLTERLASGHKAKVAANLPYYITTPLIMKLLEEELPIERIVIMIQKEVADRLVAAPGGKDYGALSVAVQYYTEPQIVQLVSRDAFLPSPEVDSAVVALAIRKAPPVDVSRTLLFRVVKAAFGQRRKTLGNSLASGLGLDKQLVAEALHTVGIDQQRRGETLSLEEFAALTRVVFSEGASASPLGTDGTEAP